MHSSPLYEPLGYIQPKVGQCAYYVRVEGRERCFRVWELQTLAFLLELHPDIQHWRDLFPGYKRGRIDYMSAAAYFIAQCRAKGMYQPEYIPAEMNVMHKRSVDHQAPESQLIPRAK